MLRLIMDSAIHWIKAGLSLKTLKIVLYSRNPKEHDRSLASLFECFQKFKDKYEEKELAYVSLCKYMLSVNTHNYLSGYNGHDFTRTDDSPI